MSTNAQHTDVLIVGAGLSGIDAAYRIRERNPELTYSIVEQRERIGGTWDLFRYPGVRSDSDIFTLSLPFHPWPKDRTIAEGGEIREYLEDVASTYGIDKHIQFGTTIKTASFDSARALWTVTGDRAGEQVEFTARFLYMCSGYYRYDSGYLPEFAGIDDFKGQLVHPQFWPEDLDYRDKKVVVIGSGATAITLIPSMAADVEKITMLQRSPTYIMSLPDQDIMTKALRRVLPKGLAHNIIRVRNAIGTFGFYLYCRLFPNLSRRTLRTMAKVFLPSGYPVDVHFKPNYKPWDQRLCVVPNGDLFKAIKSGKADVVTDHIDRFTADGIKVRSGETLPADIVVTATGLQMVPLGAVEFDIDGEPVKVGEHFAYRGYMLSDIPNLAWSVGYTNASWTLRVDLTAQAFAKLLAHMTEHGYTTARPSAGDQVLAEADAWDLTSGYVQRASGLLPKASTANPWKVRHNLVLDHFDAARYDVTEAIVFGKADEPVAS